MRMVGHKASQAAGPGGRDCTCCGEAPGKKRKKARRVMKRRERQQWKKEEV